LNAFIVNFLSVTKEKHVTSCLWYNFWNCNHNVL